MFMFIMQDLTRENKKGSSDSVVNCTWTWCSIHSSMQMQRRCFSAVLWRLLSSLFPLSSHQKIPLWFRLAHDIQASLFHPHSLLSSCLFSIAAPHSHPDTYILFLFSWTCSSVIPCSLLVDSCGKCNLSWMRYISMVWQFLALAI